MRIGITILALLVQSSLGAQVTDPRAALDSTVMVHSGDLARLGLRNGVAIQFDGSRERGRVEAVLQAIRGDTLFLESRDRRTSAHVLIGDVTTLAIRVPRSRDEGFWHFAMNGVLIVGTVGVGLKLTGNLIATGTGGKRLHSITDGLLDHAAAAVFIAVPAGLIGLAFPGEGWKAVRLR